MSEDARKDCRTQGKYSDRSQYYGDRKPQKRQDKRQKVSPSVKEPLEKKIHKRNSDGGKESNTSLSSESESPVRYQENSAHSFSQLEDVKKPIEIKDPGKHVLSTTEKGESVVFYDPFFFESDEAYDFMSRLRNTTSWHEKNIVIHGEEFPQPRLVAWYGPFPYSYSGATLEPAEMPDCVVEIKTKVEQYLREKGINVQLNSVLLNLYRHNKDSVSWHSDDEMSMGVCPTIASVSLGETRRFEMRRKVKLHDEGSSSAKDDEYFVHLRNGSLIVMDGCMQKDWQHRVPKEYHDRYERINLTFRTVYDLEDLPPSPGTYSKNQPIDNALKKPQRIETDFGVNYDDENFPPLNSDSSFVCPDIAKKSQNSFVPKVIKTVSEFSGSHKRRENENSSYNKNPLKSNNEITGTEEMWDSEPSPCNKTSFKVDDKLHKSEKKWDRKVTHNKSLSKTHYKINEPNEIDNSEYSSHSKTSLKSDDKSNGSELFWDRDISSCNENFLQTDAKINGSNKCASEPLHMKKSTLSNNLNDDKKNAKIDMQNKNLHAYGSNFSSNNLANGTANARKNKSFKTENSHVPTKSPVNNIQENAFKVKSEPTSNKTSASTLNVEAKEFVPGNKSAAFCESNTYGSFGLENLLNYNVDVMSCESLKDYAVALKNRVLESIYDFKYSEKEQLEFLCDITDGNQTDRNQKMITSRMLAIVERALKNPTSPNYRKPYGIPRKPNHGNQNHYSDRRYQGGSRESHNRY